MSGPPADPDSPWRFNTEVAQNFDQIARTNIPNYEAVIDKCLAIAEAKLAPTDAIIDIGSATGFTLAQFWQRGFRNLLGVDSSAAMLQESWREPGVRLIESDCFPVDDGPFSMVLANWVLHFIDEREAYLAAIYQGLASGGFLLLSEKLSVSELSTEQDYQLKRQHGIEDSEIARKRRALDGVLVTRPLQWYLDKLDALGFVDIELIDAHFSFATILARKPG